MLRDNGFQKVKLFDPEDSTMNALSKSGIQVMVGIPNEMLAGLSSSMKAAEDWVSKNVSSYIKDGVDIRYVAVGNEPFLETYNGSFLQTTFPALQNIQSALIKAGVSSQVKVTVPLNADVYESSSGKPSDGNFRMNIHDLMVSIVKFLGDNGGPFTVNIYPFISLYKDPNFPVDYAFFDGMPASPVVDGSITYTNVFDANHDTLVWALQKNGYGNLSIIVGEIGWPTDGDMNANIQYAQRFNQGFMKRVASGQGTPVRPGAIDAYLFSLIDEDQKSIQPGNFERHWGIFYYDGQTKYQLNISTSKSGTLVGAKNVKYLDKKWCVFKPSVNLDDSRVAPAVSYACAKADCTSLGYKTSCGDLDARGNVSYAFNSYYQVNDQDNRACDFQGIGTTTDRDPSTSTCRFEIMIEAGSATSWRLEAVGLRGVGLVFYAFLPFLLTLL
ncbi:glucan endo-1,3-beta-glucosidase 6 [Cocos nucifera]|uniref:glucan endo-1,3-beta-D-glucosidase n=1 Tax=Cocos nucifera TaxID=13894 RepID=A0A8K0MUN5_COCNU|nr:glucan endo-1,3-beta-glucosidase 6 [Cocos nucifera]